MISKYLSIFSDQSSRAFRIILIYMGLSFLWIYFSDIFVYSLDFSESTKTTISTIKGWLFVIVSAMILFQLIRKALIKEALVNLKLKESEERHRLLFQKSKDGILYADENGKIISANETACKMLGLSEQDIKKKGMQGIVDKYDPLYSIATTVRDRNGFFLGEINLQNKTGTKFPVEMSSNIVVDKKGNKSSIVLFRDLTERKKNEAEKKRWVDAFENCAHGIAIGDHKSNTLVACNSAYAEFTGRTINEIVGTPIYSLYVPSELEHVKKSVMYASQFGKVSFESVMIKKNGTHFPVQMDIVCVKDDKGEIAYRVATLQDISERKKAETELRKSELRFQQLVELAPDAIFLQRNSKFYYVNECALNLFGYSTKEEIIGKDVLTHFHPDSREEVKKRIEQLNKSLAAVPNVTEKIITKDGNTIYVEASAIPFLIENENGALVFLRDITERIKAETEIQINRELLKLAGEMAKIGGWEFDAVTGEGSWSDQVAIIHDMDPSDPTSKNIGVSVYEEKYRESIENAIKDAVEKGTPYDLELEMVTPKGNRKWVRTKGQPIYEKGKVVKLHGSFQDITDIKKNSIELEKHKNHLEELVKERTNELNDLNQKLTEEIEKEIRIEYLLRSSLLKEQQLNELKGRFISTVSHEFRTPLTSVLTSIELMERYGDKWEREKTNIHIDRIKKSVASLAKLLDDVILINRSDADKLEFKPRMIELDELLKEIVSTVRTELKENQILEYSYIGEAKEFILDDKLINSIVNNILNNSIKYSPGGGTIKLNVTSDSDKIQLQFSDEGLGIPKKDFSHMFEIFHRAENVEDIKGTGLGLSIVKRAVDLHNGNISFDSELGKGTKFSVTIPAKRAE